MAQEEVEKNLSGIGTRHFCRKPHTRKELGNGRGYKVAEQGHVWGVNMVSEEAFDRLSEP